MESCMPTGDGDMDDNRTRTACGPPPPRYHNSRWRLLHQGAEARVWFVPSLTTGGTAALCKERFSKSYRHPDLDAALTKGRMKAEARCLVKCRRGGVFTPAVLAVDFPCLFLEYVHGCTVRHYFDSLITPPFTGDADVSTNNTTRSDDAMLLKSLRVDKESREVAGAIGVIIAKMHNVNVIHGDLTTSNIMLRNYPPSLDDLHWTPDLVLIDFGLATNGSNPEEKAVDMYVFERALEATHAGSEHLMEEVLRAYKGTCKTGDSVLQRLGQVRLRGRKRECFG